MLCESYSCTIVLLKKKKKEKKGEEKVTVGNFWTGTEKTILQDDMPFGWGFLSNCTNETL